MNKQLRCHLRRLPISSGTCPAQTATKPAHLSKEGKCGAAEIDPDGAPALASSLVRIKSIKTGKANHDKPNE